MPSIQAPALGSSAPDEAPTNSSSMPCPQARANSATPPSTRFPVWEMNSSTPASGAATHGPTISAETMPMINAAPALPPGILDRPPFRTDCMAEGVCRVKTSNIANASNARTIAKSASTQGVCSQIDKLAPIRPASTPSTVYTTDIPRTYAPANAKPRQSDTLARAPASPATMARRIGTMGRTHGVQDNNSPKTRNDSIILAQPRSDQHSDEKKWLNTCKYP